MLLIIYFIFVFFLFFQEKPFQHESKLEPEAETKRPLLEKFHKITFSGKFDEKKFNEALLITFAFAGAFMDCLPPFILF
jgi:hypothetical protein